MAKSKTNPEGRGRELLGIFLVAFALFAGLALVSMQAGKNRLMGPGGAATAAAFYTLAGCGAYLFVLAASIVAWRCFRRRPTVDGLAEGAGAIGLVASSAVLLHLPFAGAPTTLHGPGGLLGQWLGEVTATFIGAAGATLAAATILAMSLLLVSEIRMQEVAVVLAWAARQAGRGLWAAARAAGRVAVAIFPERDDEPSAAGRNPAGDWGSDARADEDAQARAAGIPEGSAAFEDSDAIRVGDGGAANFGEREAPGGGGDTVTSAATDQQSRDRADVSALVAEVAAVEQVYIQPFPLAEDLQSEGDEHAALASLDAVAGAVIPEGLAPHATAELGDTDRTVDGDAAGSTLAASSPADEPGAPIIVEPAFRARQRAAAGEADEPSDGDEDGDAHANEPAFIKLGDGDFALPATSLLEYKPPQAHDTDKQALYDMAERLEQAMANYGVRGKVKEIHMGPVVTMYEFAPAPGTRTGKIANLEKDLAMALEAQAVRIVAPIPGKAVVGVEVPNHARETVYLKEILEDSCFTGASSKLQVGLGKDIKGAPVSVNLSKMPHLLVAGTTGSGKSVAVNGMITSVLFNASPDDVRFIMVDPKMLELSIYEGIPHLLLPVVTDPKKANLALHWAVEEMERRYELLAKTGVRDIAGYNAKVDASSGASGKAKGDGVVAKAAEETPSARARAKKLRVVIAGPDGTEQEVEVDAESEALDDADGVVAAERAEEISAREAAVQATAAAAAPPRKLPYIVIVIDEFADLMMVAPKEVETSVARIAQKARAAGLHLILATQRPSVDVITGLIKANFPSRIALQVASKIDSRTILDQPGAETLLGNGDMLFSDRGTKLRRIHGAFLSDDEVHRVVEFLKTQGKPVYDLDILKPREEEGDEGQPADAFHDEIYDQAVAIVCETRQASVSFIQRRLQIGYNRAARMVEQMEREGIVGPANGAKPREVIAPPGDYLQAAGAP